VQATVVDFETAWNSHGRSYFPVVRFTCPDGEEHTVTTGQYDSLRRRRLGETVTVLVDSTDHDKARFGNPGFHISILVGFISAGIFIAFFTD